MQHSILFFIQFLFKIAKLIPVIVFITLLYILVPVMSDIISGSIFTIALTAVSVVSIHQFCYIWKSNIRPISTIDPCIQTKSTEKFEPIEFCIIK